MSGFGGTPFGFGPTSRPTLWGRDLWGWGPTDDSAAAEAAIVKDLYRLEVTDKNGSTLARLPNLGSGHFVDWRNRANQLAFTYPADDDAVQYFTFGNRIRRYNRSGTVEEMYHLATTELRSDVSGRQVYVVECESTISQLGRDVFESYAAAPGATIGQIVNELLDLQAATAWAKVYYGTITSGIRTIVLDDGFSLRNFTILSALHQLRAIVPGASILEVDTNNRLRWVRPLNTHTGNRLNLGRNMQQISIKTDFRTVATRLTGYGAGVDAERLTTTRDALTQGLYGVIVSVFSDPKITEQDRLDEAVQILVDRLGAPLQRITADAIDLSLIEDTRYNFTVDTLELNAPFTIMADGLSSPFISTIQGIGRDIFAPAHVQLMLTDPTAGAAGKTVGAGTGLSEVWAGNLDSIIMDAIDMLAALLGNRDLGEGDLNMIETLVQYFIDNPSIVGTFVPFSDTVPTLYHDYATAGVAETTRRGDARPGLDPKLTRTFHADDQASLDAQQDHGGAPPVIFQARDLAVVGNANTLKAWKGNPSDDGTPGEWVEVASRGIMVDDDLAALQNRPNLLPSDPKYVERFTEPNMGFVKDQRLQYIWIGNDSDHETDPGEFQKVESHYSSDAVGNLPDPTTIPLGSVAWVNAIGERTLWVVGGIAEDPDADLLPAWRKIPLVWSDSITLAKMATLSTAKGAMATISDAGYRQLSVYATATAAGTKLWPLLALEDEP